MGPSEKQTLPSVVGPTSQQPDITGATRCLPRNGGGWSEYLLSPFAPPAYMYPTGAPGSCSTYCSCRLLRDLQGQDRVVLREPGALLRGPWEEETTQLTERTTGETGKSAKYDQRFLRKSVCLKIL